MHILMLSDVYFPRINGVSTSIQSFVRCFRSLGHDTTLIAPEYPNQQAAEFEIVRIPSRKLLFDPEDRLMSLGALKRSTTKLKERHFDIVHIQTPFVGHIGGIAFARSLGIKTVVTYHTFFEAYLEQYLPWLPKPWLRYAARTYSKKTCNQVDGVVSPSREMLRRLREYGVSKQAAIIPTGLPPDTYRQVQDDSFRTRHGIPENAYLLLYVGRVAHEKNIEFLIEVFTRVVQKVENAWLLIAGEGPALNVLRDRVKTMQLEHRIRFTGYLDRTTELPACYHAADLFVFASQTETQGLVLLEAMAHGLPVVASACMGTRDVLENGAGCVVSPLVVEEFAKRVVALHGDNRKVQELSLRALEYARRWTIEDKAKELLAFYQKILGNEHIESCPDAAVG